MFYPASVILVTGTGIIPSELYLKMSKAIHKLFPFFQYYFEFYHPNKKAIVISMLKSLGIYNEHLYESFIQNIQELFSKVKTKVDIEEVIQSIFVT